MNKNKLTSQIHKISKEKDVSFNIILQTYFFESFLQRLALSDYKDQFVLKGGFLLSSFLGIELRSTLDIDFSLQNISFERENIERVITDIIAIDNHDDITYSIKGISIIQQHHDYQGYTVALIGRLDNIKVPFSIDMAYGDPITPNKIHYRYNTIVSEQKLSLMAYNHESVLAEKLQTIVDKRTGNSRMKDFYDIYLINTLQENMVDTNTLKTAILNTFKHRVTEFNKVDIEKLLLSMTKDDAFLKRWDAYINKNPYVHHVSFTKVIDVIMSMISKI